MDELIYDGSLNARNGSCNDSAPQTVAPCHQPVVPDTVGSYYQNMVQDPVAPCHQNLVSDAIPSYHQNLVQDVVAPVASCHQHMVSEPLASCHQNMGSEPIAPCHQNMGSEPVAPCHQNMVSDPEASCHQNMVSEPVAPCHENMLSDDNLPVVFSTNPTISDKQYLSGEPLEPVDGLRNDTSHSYTDIPTAGSVHTDSSNLVADNLKFELQSQLNGNSPPVHDDAIIASFPAYQHSAVSATYGEDNYSISHPPIPQQNYSSMEHVNNAELDNFPKKEIISHSSVSHQDYNNIEHLNDPESCDLPKSEIAPQSSLPQQNYSDMEHLNNSKLSTFPKTEIIAVDDKQEISDQISKITSLKTETVLVDDDDKQETSHREGENLEDESALDENSSQEIYDEDDEFEDFLRRYRAERNASKISFLQSDSGEEEGSDDNNSVKSKEIKREKTGKTKYQKKIGFPCTICSRKCRTPENLSRHLLSHKDKTTAPSRTTSNSSFGETDSSLKRFQCPQCSYRTKKKNHLQRHMLTHSDKKSHKCQFCKFSTKRRHSLFRHLKAAHSFASIYECSVCNYKFNVEESFKVHVAMHAATKSTECLVCKEQIPRRANLIEHLLSHSSDEKFSCRMCSKSYDELHWYLLHLLSHKDGGNSLGPVRKSELDLNSSGEYVAVTGVTKNASKTDLLDETEIETDFVRFSSLAQQLASLTKVVSFSNEKPTVASQLTDLSTFAARLATISKKMASSYKVVHALVKSEPTPQITKQESKVSISEEFESGYDENESVEPIPPNMVKKEVEEVRDEAACMDPSTGQLFLNLSNAELTSVPTDISDMFSTVKTPHLQCLRCDQVFNNKRSLKRHIQAHDDIRPYPCPVCGFAFRRPEHLKKHMSTHSADRPFPCSQCAYAAKTERQLKCHMVTHSTVKPFKCDTCSAKFHTGAELSNHSRRHDKRECTQCGFVCFSRLELKRHIFTHSTFDCSECDFTTTKKEAFNRHMSKHNEKLQEELCCELCGWSTNNMKKFRYHKLRHENKTPYQCPDCDYKCSSRASYDCHRLKHAGLKPYLCSNCGSSFRKSSHLKQHMLIHTDTKNFHCSKCSYSCRTKHSLDEHEMTHSGEKPFACKVCSFSCRRKKALLIHMAKHERGVDSEALGKAVDLSHREFVNNDTSGKDVAGSSAGGSNQFPEFAAVGLAYKERFNPGQISSRDMAVIDRFHEMSGVQGQISSRDVATLDRFNEMNGVNQAQIPNRDMAVMDRFKELNGVLPRDGQGYNDREYNSAFRKDFSKDLQLRMENMAHGMPLISTFKPDAGHFY